MSYELIFTGDGKESMGKLERGEREQAIQKLERIATCPYRHPTDWDFVRMDGCAEGRFSITSGLRVFADIDDQRNEIRIHQIGRRENLYT